MPLLVEHFIEHKEESPYLTLWQFLYMHYAMGDVKDADYDKDMKLPFKSPDNCLVSFVAAYLPSPKWTFPTNPEEFLESEHFKMLDTPLQSSFNSSIWQPPRAC